MAVERGFLNRERMLGKRHEPGQVAKSPIGHIRPSLRNHDLRLSEIIKGMTT